MMRLAAFLITFCVISPVWALTCKTDGSGGCAGTAAVATDCASLGFKKEDVAGCNHYLYCPFDQNYKACVAKEDTPPADECADYPLTSCPANANCSECQSGDTTKYKINSCKNGYHLSGNTCVADSCTGYPLDSCPANANCSECQSGTTTKYKVNSCKSGYHLSGNTCVADKPESDNWPTVLYIKVGGTYPNAVSARYGLGDASGKSYLGIDLTHIDGEAFRSIYINMRAWSKSKASGLYSLLVGWLDSNNNWTSTSDVDITGNVTICAPYSMDMIFESTAVHLSSSKQTGTITATLKNNNTGKTVTKTLTVKTDTLYSSCPSFCNNGGSSGGGSSGGGSSGGGSLDGPIIFAP